VQWHGPASRARPAVTETAREPDVALSVVLSTFNREDLVGGQLEALARQEWSKPWEVVVADNGSTDSTLAIVESYRERLPQLRVVDASERPGMAYAMNAATAVARGRAFAFLNDDDEVATGWLAAMGAALERHPFVAARLDVVRFNPPWVIAFRNHPQYEKLDGWYRAPDWKYAAGAAIGVQRVAHEAVGGFDARFVHIQDVDYCFRLALAGYPLTFVPDAVVHYRFRDDLRGTYRNARAYGQWTVPVYKRFVPLGLPRPPRTAALRGWAHLAKLLLLVRDRASLARFVWQLGWRIGLVQGSVRFRYLLLSE
jgi:glycosyltransferase involved in cell wall biosynthesis